MAIRIKNMSAASSSSPNDEQSMTAAMIAALVQMKPDELPRFKAQNTYETRKEVADKIGTTEHVVKNYLRVIYDKLGLWNRVELALWYESRRTGPTLLSQYN